MLYYHDFTHYNEIVNVFILPKIAQGLPTNELADDITDHLIKKMLLHFLL